MKRVQPPYPRWEKASLAQNWHTYHFTKGKISTLYAGNRDTYLVAQVRQGSPDHIDWLANFPNSELVEDEDDAVAAILGTNLRAPPTERDHKPIVTMYPAPLWSKTFLTSAFDDLSPTPPSSGRGDGALLRVTYDGTETGGDLIKSVEGQFNEPTSIHDGECNYKPVSAFTGADTFNFSSKVKRSQPTLTLGTGNLNALQDFPVGHDLYGAYRYQYNSEDNGSHTTADLVSGKINSFTEVYPVRTVLYNDAEDEVRVGYWDANPRTGELTPNLDGMGEFDLVDAGMDLVGYIVKRISVGSPRGVFEIDSYRVEWVHQSWVCKFEVQKAAVSEPCEVNGWVLLFRRGQS